MRAGADGLPNPADRVTIKSGGGGPVNLVSGPGGDIFYPGLNDERLHRITYTSGNLSAHRGRTGEPDVGSVAPDGQLQRRADRAIPRDRRSPTPGTWTATGRSTTRRRRRRRSRMARAGRSPCALRVTDSQGLSDVAAVVVSVNNTAPTPTIAAPQASFTWRVGDTVAFSGSASDPQDGSLPAVGADVVGHHAPLPVELPHARHPAVRRRCERLVRCARSRVPVAPRAASHGDRQRRTAGHHERSPESTAGHADIPVQPHGAAARRQRHVGGDAVHPHRHHRVEQLRQRAGAANTGGDVVRVLLVVRRRRAGAQHHGARQRPRRTRPRSRR